MFEANNILTTFPTRYYAFLYLILFTGPLEPVEFNYVLLNYGGAWNAAMNSVYLLQSGVYYIHINTGMNLTDATSYELVWNGVPFIGVVSSSTGDPYIQTRGRAIMQTFHSNDTLRMRLANRTSLYSTAGRYTSFTGFILFPV